VKGEVDGAGEVEGAGKDEDEEEGDNGGGEKDKNNLSSIDDRIIPSMVRP